MSINSSLFGYFLQLIMPSSLPKTKSESLSDANSVKSHEEEVLEVVAPTEPVLPFFSLPPTPTITTAATTGNTMVELRGNIIRSGNGYQSTSNGYKSSGNGYQSTGGNGYQSTGGNGYQSNAGGKGYQSNGYGYKTNGNGYQGSNICQSVAKSRFVGDSRGDGVVAPAAVISCFVGDQRQSNDKDLRRCGGGNPSPAADVAREFLFPAAETVTDETRSHHEQASE